MAPERAEAIAAYDKPWAYVVLTKPDVTFLVVITTVAGFYLGSAGSMEWLRLVQTLCGTLLVAAGTAALNQYIERDMDSVMRRTAGRPLPTGILQPGEVLWFGVTTILAGTVWLALAINALAALLALATSVSYLAAYTPLKTRTTLATAVGAIPGALPPLIGWAAARGNLSGGAWVCRDCGGERRCRGVGTPWRAAGALDDTIRTDVAREACGGWPGAGGRRVQLEARDTAIGCA